MIFGATHGRRCRPLLEIRLEGLARPQKLFGDLGPDPDAIEVISAPQLFNFTRHNVQRLGPYQARQALAYIIAASSLVLFMDVNDGTCEDFVMMVAMWCAACQAVAGHRPQESAFWGCISCRTIGVGMLDLGTTHYDSSWHTVSTIARSAYSLGGRAFDMRPEQLAPLGPRYLNELNAAQLTRATTALVGAFDELDLANLSWAYWHACAATPHIAPAHFGAAIEALQNAYIKSRPGVVAEAWAPRADWKTLRAAMAAAIDGSKMSDEAKAALKAKLATFNTMDQRPRLKAVMAAIGLQLGIDEDAAWRRRNKAAHGTPN
jgi:hypothetical protein